MRSTSNVAVGSVVGLTVLVGVAVLLSTLSGCGQEKSLPTPDPEPESRGGGEQRVIPAASEEQARQVVERAIRAMTDGHPERVQKTKVNRSTAKGHYYKLLNGQYQFVETHRVFQAVYPDRARADYDFKPEGYQLTIGMRRPAGVWAKVTNGPAPAFDPQQFAEVVAVDAIGTHWMLTLTPLAEPKTVAFGFATASADGRPYDTIKVSIPGYPVVFGLWFEQASARLTRVDYSHLEAGVAVTKVIALSEHRPFAGLTLPTKIEYTRNGQIAEQWAVESWEFPDTIDDAVFVEPK
jgi:hypothetical protein